MITINNSFFRDSCIHFAWGKFDRCYKNTSVNQHQEIKDSRLRIFPGSEVLRMYIWDPSRDKTQGTHLFNQNIYYSVTELRIRNKHFWTLSLYNILGTTWSFTSVLLPPYKPVTTMAESKSFTKIYMINS